MKRKIIWFLVSCVMVAALVLASCGPTTPTTPTTPGGEEPQYGGKVTLLGFYVEREPISWDPADASGFIDYYCSPYMEKLVMGDLQKGPRGTNEWPFNVVSFTPNEMLTGNLAESWEMPDALTLVVHMRKGIKWQAKPGVMAARELTAEDAAFSFNRYLNGPKRASATSFVDSVTATDKYTLVFKFNEFSANWGTAIFFGRASLIYPPELVDADITDWRNAVGSGPFMLTDYVSGASVTYEKNPTYWNTETIDGKEYPLPFVDSLHLPIILEESTRVAALRTGKADIMNFGTYKYAESLEKSNPDLQMWAVPPGKCRRIFMRTDTEPFDDIRVRQALNMAVDNQAIFNSVHGGVGNLLGYLFSSAWTENVYTPLEKLPEDARMLFEYHPEKAKQLLAEAGYPNGFETFLECASLAEDTDIAAMVVSYWQDIGVECEIRPMASQVLYSLYTKKNHTGMVMYPSTGNGDPINQLRLQGFPGAKLNGSIVNDPEFTEALLKIEGTVDSTERNALIKQLNVDFISKAYYVGLPEAYGYRYAQPWIRNYYGENESTYYGPFPIYTRIWQDLDMKNKMLGN
ncbi:ABC transporter substrate-binding protein [Chloroflexota bacterium]